MTISLDGVDISAWRALENAAIDSDSAFRFLNFCSVDTEGRPQARMVVLRHADRSTRLLEFHTDVRSQKWREIAANPQVTVLGYCNQTRLQLRLQGTAEQYASQSELATAAWSKLPARTQRTYTGGPPGDKQIFDIADEHAKSEPDTETEGKRHFGVLLVRVTQLDWYQLQKENNQRALISYADGLTSRHWITP